MLHIELGDTRRLAHYHVSNDASAVDQVDGFVMLEVCAEDKYNKCVITHNSAH